MPSLKNAPEFETQDQTTTKEIDVTTTKEADAGVQATTAIAKAATTSVGQAKKFTVAFSEYNNVFDTTTVEGLSLAVPRLKAEQGSIFKGDTDLGSSIQFNIVSFNHRWAIGTGSEDKEAKDFFRVSYDNVTISGHNVTVKEYLDGLKAQGFSNAKSSAYLDIFGFVTWTEKGGAIPVENREICILQCSQTSLGAFTAFATTQGLLQAQGVVKPFDVIEVHAEKRTSGTNKYTNFSFHTPKAK